MYTYMYVYICPSIHMFICHLYIHMYIYIHPSRTGGWVGARRTPRPCSVCGSPRLYRRRERRLVGARFGRWREEIFGRARCLTLRYSLLLCVWVDPSAEHIYICTYMYIGLTRGLSLTWYGGLTCYFLHLSSLRMHFEPWKAVGTRGRNSLAAR